MKEAYVSYEVAKLLKEKGFDWVVNTYYCDDYNYAQHDIIEYKEENYNSHKVHISAPTQQMACRWLREMKNIDIEPFVYSNHHGGSKDCGCNIQENGHLLMTESFVQDTYEEAVEAALEYCLTNLI